ncbi:MAG: Asp-tRNA(Asn)/Glu-tRNA(Gln) amidotransferase GatCAB subunit B [Bacteroidetes bacterium]|nr:MAG: Asp-tRNA(Asn)/Glu-tRNA(Gln) amidotransferase GatCAB subunit B [Bacteroidota bacterium]PTM14574.1 MAG: Asp-tRNA(Asn)/Glu-tRNA(Gln) amidotransferase GatCAB subunit B [Bacteroidota bacterium]
MTYETVIGLEIHVQLSTRSKAFCGDDIRFGGAPNSQVSAISLGHPGTLPRLNAEQVKFAARLGLALGSTINLGHTFDRKNYFYADLPKGYQITQDARPICVGGSIEVLVGGETKTIRIHHVHMEEDAGKSQHDSADAYSYIDLNRAGTPLLEIVTEPDLRSAEEVDALMTAMRQLVRYLDISDGNMQEGSMRCDCNVSIRPQGATYLGNRCEIKNLNSMRYARKAIEYEVQRQIGVVEAGGKIDQQTLNFDPATGVTSPLRSKEDAHDYRYFPDPDIPPIQLTAAELAAIQAQLPALPWVLRKKMITTYGLSAYNAELLTAEAETAAFFLALSEQTAAYTAAANLIINKVLPWRKEQDKNLDSFPLSAAQLAELIELIETGQVSNSTAYQELFPALVAAPDRRPAELATANGWLQSADADELGSWVDAVLAAHPDKVKAYQQGKKGLLGFFMGEVMKRSKGQAEPKKTTALLQERLG